MKTNQPQEKMTIEQYKMRMDLLITGLSALANLPITVQDLNFMDDTLRWSYCIAHGGYGKEVSNIAIQQIKYQRSIVSLNRKAKKLVREMLEFTAKLPVTEK